ncbi:MAG: bifunctional folylpolyglutamate synthase/dihydrofolate synthase [Inquilinus sp.]|nr:bifunctional folylpolyglutamate synthase/dihydrofolate synthase [Inquilinus sp.]
MAPPPRPPGNRSTHGAVDAALERLLALHPKRIDLSLDRVFRLLSALGDPHLRVPPAIHVAGTNGKGSVVAFLRAALEAAGHRVHAYTSPHLVRFNERIRVAGRMIEDDALVDLLARCETVNAGQQITFFEITTCAAFLAFAETPADVLLLETGLGGRLDTTNVLDRPALTAITRVSMDHTQYLGDTLAAIAGEKAGILKPGVPVVMGPQKTAAVAAIVRERAAAIGAPVFEFGVDWHYRVETGGIRLDTGQAQRLLPLPNLPGVHQIENAATAAMCLERLAGLAVPEAAVAAGLRGADWPARLQRLEKGPLVESLPSGWELWLDGGHNDSAGEALAAWAGGPGDGTLHLVAGMLSTRDPRDFLAPLARHLASLQTVAIPGEQASLSARQLAESAHAAGIANPRPAADLTEALKRLAGHEGPARVLIAGSLYLAGRVLSENS